MDGHELHELDPFEQLGSLSVHLETACMRATNLIMNSLCKV